MDTGPQTLSSPRALEPPMSPLGTAEPRPGLSPLSMLWIWDVARIPDAPAPWPCCLTSFFFPPGHPPHSQGFSLFCPLAGKSEWCVCLCVQVHGVCVCAGVWGVCVHVQMGMCVQVHGVSMCRWVYVCVHVCVYICSCAHTYLCTGSSQQAWILLILYPSISSS